MMGCKGSIGLGQRFSAGGSWPPGGHKQVLSWIPKRVYLRVYVKAGCDVDLLRGHFASFLLFVGHFSKYKVSLVRELKFNKIVYVKVGTNGDTFI